MKIFVIEAENKDVSHVMEAIVFPDHYTTDQVVDEYFELGGGEAKVPDGYKDWPYERVNIGTGLGESWVRVYRQP